MGFLSREKDENKFSSSLVKGDEGGGGGRGRKGRTDPGGQTRYSTRATYSDIVALPVLG